MPYRNEVRPINFYADVQAGRASALARQAGEQRNALAQMDIEQQKRFNALSQDPNTSPDQFARMGRSDVSSALNNNQQSRQQALQQLATVARQALTLDPMSRRQFSKQSLQAYAPAYRALGVDLQKSGMELDTLDDAEIERRLQQVAAFAPQQQQDTGPLAAYIDPRTGQPVYGTREQALGQRPYDKPPSIMLNSFRPLTPEEVARAGLPPGTAAQIDQSGKIDVLSKRDNTGVLSQKDSTTAKMKLNTVALARQQLNKIREAFNEGTKGVNAFGPVQGYTPTQAGKKFDARVNQMRSTLTALTRVPGVGAMSDYETKLDQSKFPERTAYESVTLDTLNNLDDQLALIETGYRDLLSGGQSQAAPAAAPAPAGGPQPGMVEDGYRFKGGNPADPNSWERVP